MVYLNHRDELGNMMCINCESPEEDEVCERSLDELYKYNYAQIMNLVKEQELLDKKGVVLH